MIARQTQFLPDCLRRLLATGCAALVLLLGIAASSPALHALAHAHEDGDHHPLSGSTDNTDGCAVVLFGQGVSLAMDTAAPAAPAVVRRDLPFFATGELLLVAPRYLHQPERGPPVI